MECIHEDSGSTRCQTTFKAVEANEGKRWQELYDRYVSGLSVESRYATDTLRPICLGTVRVGDRHPDFEPCTASHEWIRKHYLLTKITVLSNVLKIGLVIEPEKLPVHGSLVGPVRLVNREPVVKSRLNR